MLSIKERQYRLRYLGYYKGGIDGIAGPLTRNAYGAFQRTYKLKVDKIYGPKTNAKLIEVYNSATAPTNLYCENNDYGIRYKNFTEKETRCQCRGRYCNGTPHKVARSLMDAVQNVRNEIGEPLIRTSILRCVMWNKLQGGVSGSWHMKGQAFDGYCASLSAKQLLALFKKQPKFKRGYCVTKKVVHAQFNL
jgi:zinc D-Ala-D-Ala carboxypeptidase